jgi:hypothetical protein
MESSLGCHEEREPLGLLMHVATQPALPLSK